MRRHVDDNPDQDPTSILLQDTFENTPEADGHREHFCAAPMSQKKRDKELRTAVTDTVAHNPLGLISI